MQTGSFERFQAQYANGRMQGNDGHQNKSLISESASVINLGDALIRGTGDRGVVKPSALFSPTLDFAGFAILPDSKERTLDNATGDTTWELDDQLTGGTDGLYSIQCESAFTAGTICQVVCIAAGAVAAQTVGRLTATVDATNAQPINAIFENSGAAGEVALIRITKQSS